MEEALAPATSSIQWRKSCVSATYCPPQALAHLSLLPPGYRPERYAITPHTQHRTRKRYQDNDFCSLIIITHFGVPYARTVNGLASPCLHYAIYRTPCRAHGVVFHSSRPSVLRQTARTVHDALYFKKAASVMLLSFLTISLQPLPEFDLASSPIPPVFLLLRP